MLGFGLASSQQEDLAPIQVEVLSWVVWGVISQGGSFVLFLRQPVGILMAVLGLYAAGHRLDLFRIHQYSPWIFL
jgi:hypothetical protein